MRGRLATHIARPSLALSDDIVDSLANPVRMVIEAEMSQHHAAGEQKSGWVGLVFALDVETYVSAPGLEDGDFAAHIAAWYDACTANEAGTDVGEDAAVEVGHDHHVELLGSAHALHACVVDDHVVRFDCGIFFADPLDSVAEETVGELHDVGFVDAGDLSSVVGECKGECKFRNALGLRARDDLERLDDT